MAEAPRIIPHDLLTVSKFDAPFALVTASPKYISLSNFASKHDGFFSFAT